MTKYKSIILCSVALSSTFISACSNLDFSNHVIKQGNLSSRTNIHRLKVGMSKQEVKNIMGTSLVSPMFNPNRWDYTNTVQPPNKPIQIESVSLYFRNGNLAKVVKHQTK